MLIKSQLILFLITNVNKRNTCIIRIFTLKNNMYLQDKNNFGFYLINLD